MKFFYIFCYVFSYVYVAQFCNLATFCANGVGLCRSVALLIFRHCAELMMGYKVGLDEHCYGVVYGGTAYTEFLTCLKMFHQLLYLETAVD